MQNVSSWILLVSFILDFTACSSVFCELNFTYFPKL
uniref:Uncharacterized protein n=1 Tax=Rhizophora mucronata TaxID=61149 RepID=A0A2P2NQS2_RHIMU